MAARPTFGKLSEIFLRVGNSTFGGGDPTMAVLHSELVASRGWLPPERYGLIYGLARITPGTNLLAFCAGAAWEILGWMAAVAAVSAVTLPSAIAVVLLTVGYETLRSNGPAMAAIGGTLAAAVGMMLAGAYQLTRPHLTRRGLPRAAVFTGGSLALVWAAGLTPIQVIALAAAAGALWRNPDK